METKEDIKFILQLFNSNKLEEAKKEIDKQIIKHPNSYVLYNILGAILTNQDYLEQAVTKYKKAIELNPNYAQAYNNLGTTYHKLNKMNEAIDCYKKALNIKKDFAEAFNNIGNAMREINKSKDALPYFEKAIAIKPDYAEAYYNLGAAYERLRDKKKLAVENYQKAIKIKPDYAEAYNSLGMMFSDLADFDKSLVSYNKAIELKPNYEKAHNNLGNLLSNFGKYDEAQKSYEKAIKIKPDYEKAYSNLLFNLNYKLDFDPNSYLLKAKNFRLNCKTIKKNFSFKYKYETKPKKLRIGLVSADFGNHPGGFFSLSTLRELRNKNFELIAYAPIDRNDEFSFHFKPLFLKWHSIEKQSDEEVIKKIFDDGIHILMDLQGHSAKNRLPIFMYKPAPVQLSWLGQGSTGIDEIDYFIGSPHVTPKNEEKHYVEKIFRLPEISQCFTEPDFDVKIKNLPALKNKFITFGSVNKLSKVNDDVIALWSKVLLSVANSKLFLKNIDFDDHRYKENTINRFNKHNISENRLILHGHSKTRKELLETYNKIDICLDPFPFQGNTSTIEAVWMGVPVLTLKGDRYLFHFGESINSNLNMHNWIAKNKEDYVEKAIKFSSDTNQLSKIRASLRNTALQSPVFDAPKFANHFSDMLWTIWNNFSKKNELKKK
tara:strand:+ start:1595 stop:3574 length:1980 start_codon:yes stop_codon:yes gene_type:complete